jgi:hypothetical protein
MSSVEKRRAVAQTKLALKLALKLLGNEEESGQGSRSR